MHAPSKKQRVPVCTCLQGHVLFLPHAGSVLRPRQMCRAVLGPRLRACICVVRVIHPDPFLITGLIRNSTPTSRIACSPCPCKSCPPQAASVEGLAARLPHPSAKPLSHSPSRPAVNQPAGSTTLRTLRRPWQSLCPPSPSCLPFAGGSQVTLPIPVSERTHLCRRGLFWIPGKL